MSELSAVGARSLVGFLVWLVANVVYLEGKRTGTRGLSRILAFWLGSPTTWLTLLFVRGGDAVPLEPPPDDEEALLEAVRRDRRLRRAAESTAAPPDPSPNPEAS